jgi:hypothetical protein
VQTDELIDLLAKDSAPPWRFGSVLAGAVAGGIIIAAILFFAEIGIRPDISEAMSSGRFLFKFVVTVALAVTAIGAVLTLGRPGSDLAHRGLTPAIAPVLLACAHCDAVPPGHVVLDRTVCACYRFLSRCR